MARKIVCKWKKSGQVLVNPDGQVWPCCFFCNPTYKSQFVEGYDRFDNNPVMKEYQKNKSALNVFNNSLDKIINEINKNGRAKTVKIKSEFNPKKIKIIKCFIEIFSSLMHKKIMYGNIAMPNPLCVGILIDAKRQAVNPQKNKLSFIFFEKE